MNKEIKEKRKLFKSLIKDFWLAAETRDLKLVEMAKENLLLYLTLKCQKEEKRKYSK